MAQPVALDLQEQVGITHLTTFRVPVRARWYLRLDYPDQLPHLQHLPLWPEIAAGRLPLLILGGGSNLLFTQDFPGLVIHNTLLGIHQAAQPDGSVHLTAAAGENWHQLVMHAVDAGLGGIENLALIPGTVGAAPVQNIGAYGVELDQVFISLTAWDLHTHQPVVLDRAACRFGYRDSLFKREGKGRYLITSVTFRLQPDAQVRTTYSALQQELARRTPSNPQGWTIRDIADAVIAVRQSKLPDPAVIGNAGSFFKNPTVPAAQAAALAQQHPTLPQYPQANGTVKLAAGWLIEQAGWKGRQLGNAAVHDRQALVLVNPGSATGAEVVALARRIQADVQAHYGVELETEVNIW